MNLWIKTMREDKIARDIVERNDKTLTMNNAEDMLQEMCHTLDVPTPLLTKSHYRNLAEFNFIKFLPRDFIESVDFDYMQVEMFFE
ncbi:MAG: hypothetical protein PHW00_02190 [Clostridia bacterium]|nr:hypothetical protein [Clostridia bacterium]